MDEDTASKFVSSLVKSIQSLCNGYIEFASSIEVIGHIHVNIDRNLKFNYVLSEEVNKSRSEAATVFSSHSYHSKPPPSAAPPKPAAAQSDTDRSHQKSHGSRPDDVDSRVPSQLNFSPASRDSFTSGRSDDDGVQTTSSRSRESESSRSPATQTQDSLDRRRKMRSETRTSGNSEPVLKRSRPSGPSSVTFPKEEYEVIEVKEEPDDDDSACLYGNNKSRQSGRGMQDISQPDFSNLVAESLDRVGQHEGAPLMGGNMQHLGEEPFPVTLLHNQAAGQAAPVGLSPGDPQASTSGGYFWREQARPPPATFNPLHPPAQRFTIMDLQASRARLNYKPEDMDAALEDVRNGKLVRVAAQDHGIPLSSLYYKLKMKSTEEMGQHQQRGLKERQQDQYRLTEESRQHHQQSRSDLSGRVVISVSEHPAYGQQPSEQSSDNNDSRFDDRSVYSSQ